MKSRVRKIGTWLWKLNKIRRKSKWRNVNIMTNPVSYEQKIVEIINKKESSHIAYIGKTMIPIMNYTLIANTNEKVSVSSSVYAKTNIGDKIIISCKIRDKKVISISYYEVNWYVYVKLPEDRNDVFIPNESVRDEEGRIIGCKSLGRV